MSAGIVKFVIEQGATFKKVLKWTDRTGNPIDLTGYSAEMQIRQTVDATTIEVDMTTVNGLIVLDAPNGLITLTIPHATTTLITWKTAVFDLVMQDSLGEKTRIIEGTVELKKGVTR